MAPVSHLFHIVAMKPGQEEEWKPSFNDSYAHTCAYICYQWTWAFYKYTKFAWRMAPKCFHAIFMVYIIYHHFPCLMSLLFIINNSKISIPRCFWFCGVHRVTLESSQKGKLQHSWLGTIRDDWSTWIDLRDWSDRWNRQCFPITCWGFLLRFHLNQSAVHMCHGQIAWECIVLPEHCGYRNPRWIDSLRDGWFTGQDPGITVAQSSRKTYLLSWNCLRQSFFICWFPTMGYPNSWMVYTEKPTMYCKIDDLGVPPF